MKRRILSAVLALVLIAAAVPLGISSSAASFYADAEILKIISNIESAAGMSTYATVQGSCTDGTYAYFAVQGGTTTLVKYDVATWKVVDKGGFIGLGHANDMAYNPDQKVIAVANNAPDYDVITLIDPKTLDVKGSVKIKLKIYSIAYCSAEKLYYVGISGGYDFATLDKDFNVVKKYKGVNTGYTRQGCDCDNNYVYFSQSGSNNLIVIYDHAGNHVATVSVQHAHEIENIFHVGSNFYATLHYYGNFIYRLGLSDATQIRFNVHYKPGDGWGEMDPTSVHFGTPTKLRKNTFSRDGYFFGGWKAKREYNGTVYAFEKGKKEAAWISPDKAHDYLIYDDEAAVSKTTAIGDVTMTPFWINNEYDIEFVADKADDGYIDPMTVAYRDSVTLPENTFVRYGYVFIGYSFKRGVDERTLGFRKDSDTPEWLDADEINKKCFYQPGDTVSELTYDGGVTATAEFRYAFTFSEDDTTLLEYIGIDEEVEIPDRDAKLRIVGKDAFKDNDIMTSVTIPGSVDTVETHAFDNCTALKKVVFSDRFTPTVADGAFSGSGTPAAYLKQDDKRIFLGWCDDSLAVDRMRWIANDLTRRARSGKH